MHKGRRDRAAMLIGHEREHLDMTAVRKIGEVVAVRRPGRTRRAAALVGRRCVRVRPEIVNPDLHGSGAIARECETSTVRRPRRIELGRLVVCDAGRCTADRRGGRGERRDPDVAEREKRHRSSVRCDDRRQNPAHGLWSVRLERPMRDLVRVSLERQMRRERNRARATRADRPPLDRAVGRIQEFVL